MHCFCRFATDGVPSVLHHMEQARGAAVSKRLDWTRSLRHRCPLPHVSLSVIEGITLFIRSPVVYDVTVATGTAFGAGGVESVGSTSTT